MTDSLARDPDLQDPTASHPNTTPPLKDGSDLVRQEYFFLQASVEDYQKQSLDIKKLSLGLCAGIAFLKSVLPSDPVPPNGAALPSSAVLSMGGVLFLALGFWLLDWLWKEFQRAHYPRLAEIEQIFRQRFDVAPNISGSWFGHGSRDDHSRHQLSAAPEPSHDGKPRKRFEFKTLIWPQVCLPHLPIALLAGAAILIALQTEKPAAGHPQKPPAAATSPTR